MALVVDEGQQLFSGVGIAGYASRKDSGDIGRGVEETCGNIASSIGISRLG